MSNTPSFIKHVMAILTPHGPIKARAMFGGHGIYYDDVLFASIIDDKLYFRIDESNREIFEDAASEPFIFSGGRKPVRMPYMTLPEKVFNDPQLLKTFIQTSYEIAFRHRLKKKKKPPKNKKPL